MSPSGIILVGGGGHAKVVFDALRSGDAWVQGFVDDRAGAAISCVLDHLGGLGSLDADSRVFIAIGDVVSRRRVLGELQDRGVLRVAGPAIHASALVSPSASIGEGAFVGPGAIVNADARIGRHAIVNSGAIVEHDCRVGENAHVGPGSVLGGGSVIGDDTLVGLGSRVLPGVEVGSGCVVGGGAVVIGDVGDGVTVVGVPARVSGVGV